MTVRRLSIVIVVTGMLALTVSLSTAAAATSTSYSGSTSDGGSWVADVPSPWNGNVLLYSHGFGPLVAADAPDNTTKQALLDRGYALVGSSYDPNGSWWALGSALRDQFEALSDLAPQLPSRPTRRTTRRSRRSSTGATHSWALPTIRTDPGGRSAARCATSSRHSPISRRSCPRSRTTLSRSAPRWAV